MTQHARRWLAIALGVAATVGSATFGASRLSPRRQAARTTMGPKVEDGPRPRTRITIGPSGLFYFEDDNVLRLYLEMTPRYDIVYVPTVRRWPERMPEWARHRRDDIMAEIRRLAVDRPIRWVDDDT
jgi:hypothetical protein